MLSFEIRYTSSHGEVGVSINKVNYIYFLDAGYIPRIVKLARHQHRKALTFLEDVAYYYERR